MKIEKINDNKIKCTLTQEDLKSRNIKSSELVYGSDKARALFRDMMTKAFEEVGFQADNIPLMIEAIPEKQNALVLIISKVENPDEVDTRFAKLSPSPVTGQPKEDLNVEGADDIIDIYQKLRSGTKKAATDRKKASGKKSGTEQKKAPISLIRLYRFDTLDTVIAAAKALGKFYSGSNSLFRLKKEGTYNLVIHQSSHTPEEFNKVCNILSEYGVGEAYSRAAAAHLSEHEEAVLSYNALQQLAKL